MTFLNRADGGYRVTRDPGLTRGCARGARWRLDPRTTTKHVDPDIKNYFQDSSIGARRAGGEARFDDLLLRAARGIVMPFRNQCVTKRVLAYCVEASTRYGFAPGRAAPRPPVPH